MLQHSPVQQIRLPLMLMQIVQYGERASTFGLPAAGSDTNLTFFREDLRYNDDEIKLEVQNALQFFSERFDLEFSHSGQ